MVSYRNPNTVLVSKLEKTEKSIAPLSSSNLSEVFRNRIIVFSNLLVLKLAQSFDIYITFVLRNVRFHKGSRTPSDERLEKIHFHIQLRKVEWISGSLAGKFTYGSLVVCVVYVMQVLDSTNTNAMYTLRVFGKR